VRIAFGLVGFQQLDRRSTGCNQLELPRQIGNVAHSVAHTLSEKGRRLVRCIAGEKDATHLPALGNQPVETVGRRANDPVLHTFEPGAHQSRHGFRPHHRVIVFPRQQHELPATMIAAAGNNRRGTRRVAHHDRESLQFCAGGHARQRRKLDRSVHLRIHDEPRLIEVEIIEPHVEQLAHGASRAVAADDPARPHSPRLTATPRMQRDALGVLHERLDLDAVAQLDSRQRRESLTQEGFELRLIEEIVIGPTEGTRLPHRAHVANHAVVGTDVQVAIRITHAREHAVDDAGRAEEAHHLVVEVHGARQRVRRLFTLEHHRTQPGSSQQTGCQRAHWSAADDGYVEAHVGAL
jgi:hypothetical protein